VEANYRNLFTCNCGIIIGSAMWWYMGEAGIKQYEKTAKTICRSIAIIFALYIWGKESSMKWVENKNFGTWTGVIAGILAGITSTLAHAAGPIVSLYNVF
jgi:hypothetical protein